MENENSDFQPRHSEEDISLKPFRIEVADGHDGKFFNISPLGHLRYEILNDEGSIGTIQLDETNHAHCESVGCEIDLPLIHAIREQIQFHEQFKKGE